MTVEPGKRQVIRLRLSDTASATGATNGKATRLFDDRFENTLAARRREADEFCTSVIPPSLAADAADALRPLGIR